jgi:cysteinyl-tRNA synthetase
MTHYRSPIDWTRHATEQASVALDGYLQITRAADAAMGKVSTEVLAALCDDLNTPRAISGLHSLAAKGRSGDYQAACDLKATCEALGFSLEGVRLQDILKNQKGDLDSNRVEKLIADRTVARARKDFKESDRIRDELAAMGVVIKDSKDGTTWEIVR